MTTLKTIKSHIQKDLQEVDKIINDTFNTTKDQTLTDIYTHLLNVKGKQIRASIIILISKMSTPDNNKSYLKLAAGIELIHLASLIHDDIIDNAAIRRNQPTVHTKFNTNNGIISGVHCYALALKLISSIGDPHTISIISLAVIDLCEGESEQVNNRHNFNLTIENYWEIIQKKTSALFKAACESAAHLSKLTPSDTHHLATYGQILGSIFQLSDDYLDIFDTTNNLSKKIMQDLATGDISLPILLASKPSQSGNTSTIKDTLKSNGKTISTAIKNELNKEKELAFKELDQVSSELSTEHLKSILTIISNRVNH